MSTVRKKELLHEAYDAALISAGGDDVSMAARKVVRMPLNAPETFNGAAKLAGAVAISSMLIKYGQEKKGIPTDPLKLRNYIQ